jgi:hypothetical protein
LSEKHLPKHRGTPAHPHRARLRRSPGLRRAGVLTAVAVAATGLAVSGGLLSGPSPVDGSAAALSASPVVQDRLSRAEMADREERASRSTDDRRALTDGTKARTLSNASGPARTRTVDLSSADPRTLTKALLPRFGMSASDFACVDSIWSQESGWNVHAANPTSSAYGIPQALPGSKMASAGPDWQGNARTQITWGLGYIKARYGSACAAWGFKQSHGWY